MNDIDMNDMDMLTIGIEGVERPLWLPFKKERLIPEILEHPADPDNPEHKDCDFYLPRTVAEELGLLRPPVQAFDALWYRWDILRGK